jgi:hypothetical protein
MFLIFMLYDKITIFKSINSAINLACFTVFKFFKRLVSICKYVWYDQSWHLDCSSINLLAE